MNKKLVIVLLSMIFLTACASNGRHIPRHASYSSVTYGSVMTKEEVTLGGTNTGIGSYVVSAAAIHDATSNSFLGLIARGLAGAFVGAVAEEAITRRSGSLYTVETSKGALFEVASANRDLQPGDCVQITHAGRHKAEIKAIDATSCLLSQQKRAKKSATL